LKERERLGHILALFARHGLKGLAARLGLGAARDEPLENPGPEALVALLRDLGPVAVKFGQI
jgi:ubiquinone biosynthesis protein